MYEINFVAQVTEVLKTLRKEKTGQAKSEDLWMNLQLRWDLYKAKRTELKELNTIEPFQLKEFTVLNT